MYLEVIVLDCKDTSEVEEDPFKMPSAIQIVVRNEIAYLFKECFTSSEEIAPTETLCLILVSISKVALSHFPNFTPNLDAAKLFHILDHDVITNYTHKFKDS